jgi:uncharacterized membrane-anchored protein
MTTAVKEGILKHPHLTVIYWWEKMTATTFGETFADYFSQMLDLGYGTTSAVFISIFAVTLVCQLYVSASGFVDHGCCGMLHWLSGYIN